MREYPSTESEENYIAKTIKEPKTAADVNEKTRSKPKRRTFFVQIFIELRRRDLEERSKKNQSVDR